jgi:hypothetical protein
LTNVKLWNIFAKKVKMKIVIIGATGTRFVKGYFPGHVPVTMSRVTQAYVKSTLGGQTGQIYKVLQQMLKN